MAERDHRDVERWFLARGFSALLDGTSVRRRRAARLARAMAAVFVLVMVFELPSYATSVWVSLPVSLAVVLVTWYLGNLIRRRPPFALPDRVTALDRGVFLLCPPLALLFVPQDYELARQLDVPPQALGFVAAVAMFLVQLVLLAVIGLLANSGVMALGPWLWHRVAASFLAGGAVFGRTAPLVLGVIGFMFFTGELWQSVGGLTPVSYTLTMGLFVGLGLLCLRSRGLDLGPLARFESPDELAGLIRGTPLEGGEVPVPVVCPLSQEQEQNLRLVMVISKLSLATMVGLGVFGFFVLLGMTTVNAEVVESWSGRAPDVIAAWSTGLHSYALTYQHLKVAGYLGVFAGFYCAVVSATDPSYRDSLRDDVEDDVRQACAARLVALQRYPESVG